MKFVTDILKLVRLDGVSKPNDRGEVMEIKNIGMAPDGTLRPMNPTQESSFMPKRKRVK